ncbi:alpha/beta hydrolase [Streptomyces pseudoechinosporeus]
MLVTASLLLVATATAPATAQTAEPGPQQRSGTLPDGTAYAIHIPANWNGTVVNDLDAVVNLAHATPRAQFFLDHGYAYAGTDRRPDRTYHFDPRAERDEQAQVLDIFTAEFGTPRHAIQFGCSGGGGVALGVAESYPDKVDAAISMNGADGIVMSNQRLDLLFALKALLAPDSGLPVVGISYQDREKAAKAWGGVLAAAQETGVGRARIALAGALAQVPAWGGAFAPYPEEPDTQDRDAVQQMMIRSVVDSAVYAAGIRYLYDNPAGVMSWNTGIDYRRFYAHADAAQKKTVRELYAKAGAHTEPAVRADLSRVNASPRIQGPASAVSYWKERALTGNPRVPLLQLTTVGDSTRSSAMMAAYAQGVRANGKSRLYRQALIDSPGHCTFNVPELAAALETVMRRLETGRWGGSTLPEVLNTVGRGFGLGEPRFISTKGLPAKSNRAFFPSSGPGGRQ